MFPCQTALQGQNGKKQASRRCFKSQRPKECLDIGHLRYPIISPTQNLPLKCFQTNHLQGNVFTFQNRNKHKLNENQSELFSIPKTFSNMKMLFLAPLLTAWSPSHLFPADHFGHLSCHNYAPWTRSANCPPLLRSSLRRDRCLVPLNDGAQNGGWLYLLGNLL